ESMFFQRCRRSTLWPTHQNATEEELRTYENGMESEFHGRVPLPVLRLGSLYQLRQPIAFFCFQAEDGIRGLTVTGVQTCALPISAAARRLVRLRDVHDVLAGLPSPSVRGGRAAGPETLVAAQRPLPDPARAGHAGRDPAERLRPVGRGLAPPLPAIGIRMTAHPMLALLFAPSGQNASGGLTIF